MNIFVGLLFLLLGILLSLTGILLAVGEIISGNHRSEGSRGSMMAGLNWEGIKGVINASTALIEAMGDWPLSALFVLLGLISMGIGTWILVAHPIVG